MRRGNSHVASPIRAFPHVGNEDSHGHAHLLLPPDLLLHLLHPLVLLVNLLLQVLNHHELRIHFISSALLLYADLVLRDLQLLLQLNVVNPGLLQLVNKQLVLLLILNQQVPDPSPLLL